MTTKHCLLLVLQPGGFVQISADGCPVALVENAKFVIGPTLGALLAMDEVVRTRLIELVFGEDLCRGSILATYDASGAYALYVAGLPVPSNRPRPMAPGPEALERLARQALESAIRQEIARRTAISAAKTCPYCGRVIT